MRYVVILLVFFSACTAKSPQETGYLPADSLKKQAIIDQDISDPTNTLTGKAETLELYYIVWGCECPQWVTISDFAKYSKGSLADHCIYIEPDSDSVEVPKDFDPFKQGIKVTGHFYIRPDYPKGTVQMEEYLRKAKVFRYTKVEVTQQGAPSR